MPDRSVAVQDPTKFTLEAKVGFIVLFAMTTLIAMGSWLKFADRHTSIPLHIQNAPVARHVGPDYYLEPLTRSNQPIASNDQRTREEVAVSRPDVQLFSEKPGKQPEQQGLVSDPQEMSKPEMEPTKVRQQRKIADAPDPVLTNIEIDFPAKRVAKTTPARDISGDFVQATRRATSVNEPTSMPARPTTMPSQPQSQTGLKQSVGDFVARQFQAVPKSESPTVDQVDYEQPVPNDFSAHDADASKVPQPTNPVASEMGAEETEPEPESLSLEVIDSIGDLHSQPLGDFVAEREPTRDAETTLKQHRVVKGESFWTIAQLHYDDGRLFKALYDFNRANVDGFDGLKPGSVLDIPEQSKLAQPEGAEMSTDTEPGIYVTRVGDTLFDIAREVHGQASYYLVILEINRDQLPANVNHLTRLAGGIRLQLPAR